jgi:hypothetical protein
LSRNGTPAKGPPRLATSLVGRLVEDRRDDGVEQRVERLDALDGCGHQLGRSDLAGADELGLGSRVEQRELAGH